MKTLALCGLVLSFASVTFAQRHSGAPVAGPSTNFGFGNAVFPAGKPVIGTPALNNFGHGANVGHPGFNNGTVRRNPNNGTVIYVPYGYPVYSGGFYGGYNGYSGYGDVPPQQPQQPQNITIIYPPQQSMPMMMTGPQVPPADVPRASIQEYPTALSAAADNQQQPESAYYLLAFKDHSIYSAVGYWVDGDTLHYITTGNVHNQASVSLVDRETTQQLNKGRVQVNLPPSK
jgi:hypothetical protein